MRAAVVEELSKPLVVREVPDPACPPDGAIVRVRANGICRTDWHLWTGDWSWRGLAIKPPFVLGHEFAGTIEEVGSEVTGWKQDDRVIFPMNPGEGTCEWCLSGNQHICDSGKALVPGVAYAGAFAELVAVRYADVNLVALPESISFVDVASLGCRYIAAFHGIVDQVNVRGGEWVVVHGCGGVGLAAVQVATAVGANVIAVDVFDEKLAAARDLGAVHTINATRDEPVEAIRVLTKGGAQVSIDALGIAATCHNSVMSLRKRGRHLQLGHTTRAEKGEVALVGSVRQYRCVAGRPREFDRDQALKQAQAAFWARGYEGTSMADLVQALGLASSRIYAAFGSKETLFREAIELYEQQEGGFAGRALAEEPTARAALERMLRDAVATYTRPGKPRGCMVVTAATNCSAANDTVLQWLQQHRINRTTSIVERVQAAVTDGELAPGTDAQALGDAFAALLHGLSVQARDGIPRRRLLTLLGPAMTMLDQAAVL